MSIQVRAAVALGQNQPMRLETLQLDGPRENEVLIEMKAAGLCRSDLMLFDGTRTEWTDYPIVLGHEGAGIVLECGPGVSSVRPGDHVIPVAIPECGRCVACLSGRTNQCDEYFRPTVRRPFSLDGKPIRAFCELGTFADHIVVREMQVTKIRSDAPLDVVCCLGCAGMTGIGSALYTAKVEKNSTVVVFGAGGIGLNVMQGARLAGAKMIIAVDVNSTKETGARASGATHFINSRDVASQELVGVLHDLTGGGADYSFECVGGQQLLRTAVECTRRGWGTTVMVGVLPGEEEVQLRPRAILEGRKLMGAYLGNVRTRTDLPTLVEWAMDRKLTLDSLISHRISLDEIAKGFEMLESGETLRTVVLF